MLYWKTKTKTKTQPEFKKKKKILIEEKVTRYINKINSIKKEQSKLQHFSYVHAKCDSNKGLNNNVIPTMQFLKVLQETCIGREFNSIAGTLELKHNHWRKLWGRQAFV